MKNMIETIARTADYIRGRVGEMPDTAVTSAPVLVIW